MKDRRIDTELTNEEKKQLIQDKIKSDAYRENEISSDQYRNYEKLDAFTQLGYRG